MFQIFYLKFPSVAQDPFTIRITKKTCDDLTRIWCLLVEGANSANSLKFYIVVGIVDAKFSLRKICQ